MSKFLLIVILFLGTVSCEKPETPLVETTPVTIEDSQGEQRELASEPDESFSDASNIGRPKKNRIDIVITAVGGRDLANRPHKKATIKFYSIMPSKKWELRQTLEIGSYALMEAQPSIEDFNNDGLKDITFISSTAARGANEVRTLLIYDKLKDVLVHVKNSEDFPNLSYNKTLKCIDSWMFHGATTTVFLKLEGDMLKEFASVDTGLELVVSVTDKNAFRKVIRREKMSEEDTYTRYKTFDPPIPYDPDDQATIYPRRSDQ